MTEIYAKGLTKKSIIVSGKKNTEKCEMPIEEKNIKKSVGEK